MAARERRFRGNGVPWGAARRGPAKRERL